MTQSDRGLPSVDADAKHVYLELEGDVRHITADGRGSLHANSALFDREAELAVRAEGVGFSLDLRGPERIFPGRIYPFRVINRVTHAETVERERRIVRVRGGTQSARSAHADK